MLFLLHGRLSKAEDVEPVARTILDDVHARRAAAPAGQKADDLVVVTFVRATGTRFWGRWVADVRGRGVGPEEPWDAARGRAGELALGERPEGGEE